MRGFRTQESEKFSRFFDVIQKEAAKRECVFFLDCGEGREFATETMEGEDLSGWLIPNKFVDEFEMQFTTDTIVTSQWDSFVTFVFWSQRGNSLSIRFDSF